MKKKLLIVRLTLAKLEKTPLMAKAGIAEQAISESLDLVESVVEQVQLIGESYNGLLAYINQISDDQLAVNELNEKMKKGGFGLYGE